MMMGTSLGLKKKTKNHHHHIHRWFQLGSKWNANWREEEENGRIWLWFSINAASHLKQVYNVSDSASFRHLTPLVSSRSHTLLLLSIAIYLCTLVFYNKRISVVLSVWIYMYTYKNDISNRVECWPNNWLRPCTRAFKTTMDLQLEKKKKKSPPRKKLVKPLMVIYFPFFSRVGIKR